MGAKFKVKMNGFYKGFAPFRHLDNHTEVGAQGQAAKMTNVDVLGEFMKAGPAVAAIENGTKDGILDTPMNFILDTPVSDGVTYGISDAKIHKIVPGALITDGTWPVSITDCVRGNTLSKVTDHLHYFYNVAGEGRIGRWDFSATFTDSWQTGLVKTSVMPVAVKEDIELFGHGQYVGVYFASTDTIDITKLDFGDGRQVVDIIFHANQWLIAVNGSDAGRTYGQIYAYDGSALTAILADELSVGLQRIGFLLAKDGIVFVSYQDESFSDGFNFGYLSGRKIEALAHI